ncbi:hypothetical protein DVR12_25510 [Chitinophaga silvatica]|uniref:Uncharacterized protein n=1 Tax=Chitinophaga silvatica TaxID=2282649 RepID=A0A3E1Y2T5_9BACT|nr:hypothetical protein DVR12_25510 [Chitinophaga silvatica]
MKGCCFSIPFYFDFRIDTLLIEMVICVDAINARYLIIGFIFVTVGRAGASPAPTWFQRITVSILQNCFFPELKLVD